MAKIIINEFISDNKTQLKPGEYTKCTDCPCLNCDFESGSYCNCMYDTEHYQIVNDFWYYVSSNCKLKSINYFDKKPYIPEKIKILPKPK